MKYYKEHYTSWNTTRDIIHHEILQGTLYIMKYYKENYTSWNTTRDIIDHEILERKNCTKNILDLIV